MWPTKRVLAWFVEQARDFEAEAVLFGAPHPLSRASARLKAELGIPVGILGVTTVLGRLDRFAACARVDIRIPGTGIAGPRISGAGITRARIARAGVA